MSTKDFRKFSNVRVNNIQHPALRLWFRTVIGTLFGRQEVGTLNLTELGILGSFLNVQRENRFALDLPHLVVKHFLDIAEGRIKTIEIGGLVTFLVKSMGLNVEDLAQYVTEDLWIDTAYLIRQHKWLKVIGAAMGWRIEKEPARYIVLPTDRLPALQTLRHGEGEGLPSYLIPELLSIQSVQAGRGQQSEPPRRSTSNRREEASSSSQIPSEYEVYRNYFHFETKRSAHHMANEYFGNYWTLHQQVQQGLAQPPYPTYYRGADSSGVFEQTGIDPNLWGPDYGQTYGGLGGQFLDEFGRVNVGGSASGSGYQGGNNDDYGDDGNGEDEED